MSKLKLRDILLQYTEWADIVNYLTRLSISAEQCKDASLHCIVEILLQKVVDLSIKDIDLEALKGWISARTEEMSTYEEVFGHEESVDSD